MASAFKGGVCASVDIDRGGVHGGLAVSRAVEMDSDVIGIVYPPATLFLLLSAGIFLILFQYSLILSRRTEEVKRLTQELALLEERLRRLEKRGDE